MGKEQGPLEKVTKDGDVLKKQVDKLVKESLKNAGNKKLKDKEVKLKANFRSCYELKPQVTAILQRAEDLSEENEEKKLQKNFETKKKKEIDKLTALQTQIDNAMTKLLPDEERETYEKELKKELGGEEESEEEEEEDEDETEEQTEGQTDLGETGKTEADDDDDEEEEEESDEEGDETAGETLDQPVTPKPEAKKDDKAVKEEEEEVEEEEESEEEEDEEYEDETDVEEEQTVPKKVVGSKSDPVVSKTKPEEESDEEYEDETEDEDEEGEEEESGEEEETEEEEGQEEGQTTLEMTTTGRQFEAMYDFESAEKGDLNFKKGEILTIVETQEDGWWEAENEKGEKGNVPSTYLQLHNKYKDVQQEDDEDEEEEAEEEGEEGEHKDGKRVVKRQRSGKDLWKNVKKAVNETSVTDVLHAMGAVPSGFRPSTLEPKFNSDKAYQMRNYLAPKLSNSNFSYRDLFFDPSENKIRCQMSREQRIVTLTSCRQIPVPGTGLDITSRHVRICLFDGQNILSNIHTVKVASVDREQRTWSFNTKISDVMDTFQHAEMFVRTDSVHKNLGILFELCASYERTSTHETGEFSCGWVHLPLDDPTTGLPVQNKGYDLMVNGGTPYEKGVEVDPSIGRRTSTNAFMSLISGNKQPRMIVKLSVPKREQKDYLDTLPETLIGSTAMLQMYSLYRQMLADNLLRDRLDLESTEMIHSPCLTTFPMVADQHDLMKLLRETWIEKIRSVKRAELRDAEYLKDLFKQTVMETVYPLSNSSSLPPYKTGNVNMLQARQNEIDKFRQQKQSKKSVLALLLSSDMTHRPLDMKELSYSVIGPYCLTQHHSKQVTVES